MQRVEAISMSHLKRNPSRSAVIGSSILALLLLSSPMLRAQVTNGVNGVITDSSGAAIANAHVTITNNSTAVGSETNTSSTGLFAVVGLLPGEYSVEVKAPNFATAKSQVVVEVARMST